MSETLHALRRAVIASPTDRTVRLVYADALEETGEPTDLARAEFIRAQIESEGGAFDAARLAVLNDRSAELFEANWPGWWAPLAEAAGLSFFPGKRIRDRIARAVSGGRRRREPDRLYTVSPTDATINLPEHGLTFRFAGGFPEEVRFDRFVVAQDGPELVHRWGELIPLVHLHIAEAALSATEWESVDGPHLARLDRLTLDGLLEGVSTRIAASPALANLQRLSVGGAADYRPIVSAPVWQRLRFLRLGNWVTSTQLGDVAAACTLQHLQEFELVLGNPGWLIEHMMRAVTGGVQSLIRALAQTVSMARNPSRFSEYGSALEALAAAKWIKQLRVLRLVLASATGLLGQVFQSFDSHNTEETLPDAAVLALADAVRSDKLERLVLPAALISPPVREELMRRMGGLVQLQ